MTYANDMPRTSKYTLASWYPNLALEGEKNSFSIQKKKKKNEEVKACKEKVSMEASIFSATSLGYGEDRPFSPSLLKEEKQPCYHSSNC